MILALYDVTGIQNFIFSTNKAKENIGASLIVQQVFEEYLVDVLKEMSGMKVETAWENSDKLLIKDDPTIDAEVIYIGGGNSLVLFRDLESGKRTTQALAVKLLDETKGSLGVVVGYQETNLESFSQDLVELHKKVAKKKDELKEIEHSNPLEEDDIKSALETYDRQYYNFTIDDIVKLTDIPIEKNKRNYRKQEIHLKGARAIQEINDPEGNWRNQEGRPSKESLVREYLEDNLDHTPTEIARNLGISRTTVYKYL